jgi:hypothetical protein
MPAAFSQNARVGPAMPAPDIRTFCRVMAICLFAIPGGVARQSVTGCARSAPDVSDLLRSAGVMA